MAMPVIDFKAACERWPKGAPPLVDGRTRFPPGELARSREMPGYKPESYAERGRAAERAWGRSNREAAEAALLAWGASVLPTDVGVRGVMGMGDLLAFTPKDDTPIFVEINRRGRDKLEALSRLAHAVHEHGVGLIVVQQVLASYPAFSPDEAALLPSNTAIHESSLMMTRDGRRLLIAEAEYLRRNRTCTAAPPPPVLAPSAATISIVIRPSDRHATSYYLDFSGLEHDESFREETRAVFAQLPFSNLEDRDRAFWRVRELLHAHASLHGNEAWLESKHIGRCGEHEPEYERRGFLRITRRLVT